MMNLTLRRTIALGSTTLAAMAFAVPAFAGEDDDDDTEDTPAPAATAPESSGGSGGGGGGGGSDTKHAKGGVQTGAGAMAAVGEGNGILPIALLGGGLLVLTASGLTYRRRFEDAL
jgi:hypothetical protein